MNSQELVRRALNRSLARRDSENRLERLLAIYAVLEECHALDAVSGLREALEATEPLPNRDQNEGEAR